MKIHQFPSSQIYPNSTHHQNRTNIDEPNNFMIKSDIFIETQSHLPQEKSAQTIRFL